MIEIQKVLLIVTRPGIGYQSNFLARPSPSHPAFSLYDIVKSQGLMENTWLLSKFTWPRHSSGLAPHSIVVKFHSFNLVRNWDPKGCSCHNPTWYRSPEQFLGSTFHQVTRPLSLNMVLLNPRDWWKTLTFVKICLTRHSSGLVPRSIGVRFHSFNCVRDWDQKGSSRRNPTWYRSPEQFSGSTFHRVPPRFPLIWYC